MSSPLLLFDILTPPFPKLERCTCHGWLLDLRSRRPGAGVNTRPSGSVVLFFGRLQHVTTSAYLALFSCLDMPQRYPDRRGEELLIPCVMCGSRPNNAESPPKR